MHDIWHEAIQNMKVATGIQESISGHSKCSGNVITQWSLKTIAVCCITSSCSQLKLFLPELNNNDASKYINVICSKIMHSLPLLALCHQLPYSIGTFGKQN